jgi:hypothetical protein
MKKWISLALILSSSATYATSEDCTHLKVSVRNNTPYTCQLNHVKTSHALILDVEHLPLSMPSGVESSPFTFFKSVLGVSDFFHTRTPTVTLSFICDEGHSITILSNPVSNGAVSQNMVGNVEAAEDMEANFTSTNANCSSKKASEIHWVLN